MASNPTDDDGDGEPTKGARSNRSTIDEVDKHRSDEEPSCVEDPSTGDVPLKCAGLLIRESPENNVDEDGEWPEGVEVECKLEEIPSVEDLSARPNKCRLSETGGLSVIRNVAGPSANCQDVSYGNKREGILEKQRPYGCPSCSYRGKYRSDLEVHMRTHTGEKPYECKLCDYRCSHSSHLKYHMMTHTGEKPFACSVCDYRCIHAGRLKDHMMSHTGEKPYACPTCDFKCSRTGILKRHMRMHTGEKPYACDICDYRCTETGTLTSHKRTHTGEKPYACDQCDHRSGQLSALRKHKKTHASQHVIGRETT